MDETSPASDPSFMSDEERLEAFRSAAMTAHSGVRESAEQQVNRWANGKPKSTAVAYLIFATTFLVGGHKFYLLQWTILPWYVVTLGFFGLGWLWDIFTLPSQVKAANDRGVRLGSGSSATANLFRELERDRRNRQMERRFRSKR